MTTESCCVAVRLQNSPFFFTRSPKITVFERVLARGCEMGEQGEEGVTRPGKKELRRETCQSRPQGLLGIFQNGGSPRRPWERG